MTSPPLARKARLKTHLVSVKVKLRQHVTLRRALLLAAASAASFLFLLTLRTLLSSSHARIQTPATQLQLRGQHCAKLPAPVAEALVYYATTSANNATSSQQQTAAELAVTARALARCRAPCNVLVFGGLGGTESALWAALNHGQGGRTVFLEEDASLISEISSRHPGLGIEPHQVAYQTTLADADELLALRDSPDCKKTQNRPLSPDEFESSKCKLAMRGLPAAFYETEWDVIIVDAPPGWVPEAPGRIGGAIYMAGMAARARRWPGKTEVIVHDVDRAVEDGLSMAFLCRGYLEEEVGRVRRFAVPSHREKDVMPFCP